MTVYIEEYAGMSWLRAGASQYPAPASPTLAVTVVSSAGSTTTLSTVVFQPATKLVVVTATGASFFSLIGSSTTTVPSSTNSSFVFAGTVRQYGVSTAYNRLIGWSS